MLLLVFHFFIWNHIFAQHLYKPFWVTLTIPYGSNIYNRLFYIINELKIFVYNIGTVAVPFSQ